MLGIRGGAEPDNDDGDGDDEVQVGGEPEVQGDSAIQGDNVSDNDNDTDSDNHVEETDNELSDASTTTSTVETGDEPTNVDTTATTSNNDTNVANNISEGDGDGDSDGETLSMSIRFAGKEAHDNGDFLLASQLFQKAADSLQLALQQHLQLQQPDESLSHSTSIPTVAAAAEEYATCRLHQALCYLKCEKYDECLQTCSDILDDKTFFTPAVRGRAYHRRAKAKLALEDKTGALQDARAAAFLGDRKAVALYGRLMRDTPYSNGETSTSTSTSTSIMNDIFSRYSQSNSSSSLLESLMAKSPLDDQPLAKPASPFFGGKDSKTGFLNSLPVDATGPGLAKSVVKSLAKKLDDDDTLLMISSFLQRTDSAQLNQFASMAGIDVPQNYLDRIETICHRITPKVVKRTVRTTKVAIYVLRIFRRLARLAHKYKSLLVVLAIIQWTKSAILRPIPVDRAAVRRQAKAAIKDAMKANRS